MGLGRPRWALGGPRSAEVGLGRPRWALGGPRSA